MNSVNGAEISARFLIFITISKIKIIGIGVIQRNNNPKYIAFFELRIFTGIVSAVLKQFSGS